MVHLRISVQNALNRLPERMKKSVAILTLTVMVVANAQFELAKFSSPLQANAQTAMQCNDGVDNDNDGMYDMADAGCTGDNDDSEWNLPMDQGNQDQGGQDQQNDQQDQDQQNQQDQQVEEDIQVAVANQCNDGVDNDGDGRYDMDDPGCSSLNDNDEWNLPIASSSTAPVVFACNDGLDNDGDGLRDFGQDPGCTSSTDNDEWNVPVASSSAAPVVYACNDGLDNDGDGLRDFGSDPGCTSTTDNDEWNAPVVSSSRSSVIVVQNPQCSDTIDNDGDGLRDAQDPGCHTDGNANNGATYNPADNDEWNFPIIVSSSSAASSVITTPPQCSDTVDNDGDQRIDALDPGCHTDGNANNPASYNPADNDEWNFPVASSSASSVIVVQNPQCSDTVDNDGDFRIDAQDPGCHTDGNPNNPATYNPADNDEWNFPIVSSSSSISSTRTYQCSDTVDNDGDQRIDALDPGCHTDGNPNNPSTYVPTDDDEWNFVIPSSSSSSSSSVISSSSSSVISSSSSSTTITTIDLRLSKSGPSSVMRGTNLTYTLTVTNDGPGVAQNVIVTDAYPMGFIYNDSASDSRCDLASNQVRCFLGSMNPGSTTISLNFSVPSLNPCFQQDVYNTAIVSTSSMEMNSNNNMSNTVTTTLTCPVVSSSSSSSTSSTTGTNDLSLSKSGPATAAYNSTVVYTLTVTNSGPAVAQNVIVTDAFPAGLTYIDAASDSRCDLTSGQVRCFLGNMNPGTQSLSLSFQTPVASTPCMNTNLYNTAIVSTASVDPNMNNNMSNTTTTTLTCGPVSSSSSSSSTQNNIADVAITMSANPAVVNVGDTTVFMVTVRNNGPMTAENVVANINFPSALTQTNSFATNGTYSNGTWTIGTLPMNGSAALQIVVRVNAEGTFTANGSVMSSTQDSNMSNNNASASVTGIRQQAQVGCIDILKQTYSANGSPFSTIAPFIFNLDGSSVAVTNDSTGHARFTNVPVGQHSVSETVIPGWSLMSVFPQNGVVTVFASDGNTNCSNVVFQNKLNSVTQSSSSSSAPSNTADMAITKTANPTTVAIGQETVFTISVTNNGPAAAQNVIVTDTLPSGLTFVNAVMTNGSFNGSQWTLGTMNPGNSATMQLRARMNVSGSVTNTATVSSTTQDPNLGNNSASATVSGSNQTGCIEIDKTAIDDNGNEIYSVPSFTFSLDNNRTVSNDSNGRARFDNVPTGSHTVREYTQNGWRLETVSPANGTVTVNANGSCATVYFRNRETDRNNNNYTISKTDGRSTVRPGDRLTYTITVRNNNSGSNNNVTVRDILPSELRFISADGNERVSGRTITWNNVNIPAFSTRTFRLTVEVDRNADGTITNRAEVNGRVAYDTDVVDEDDNNNGDLEITKDASTSEVFPGGMIEYTVRVRNNGDETLRNVRVIDILPANVTIIDDGDADRHNGNRMEWNLGSLSRNASRTIRYRLNVGNYAVGQFVRNDAEVTADNGNRERASAVVQVIGLGNLPQTGFESGLTASTLNLHPITGNGDSGTMPLMFWLALAGLTTGTGAGFARKFVTGI